jgi:mRNA interferase MazF
VLIVEDDGFDATDSVTPLPADDRPHRDSATAGPTQPRFGTGLTQPSSIMIDRLTTMPPSKLGEHTGRASDTDMLALSRGLVVFLRLA